MTPQEIEELFNQTVQDKDFKKKSGLDRQIVYNYRRRTLGFATKLELLYNMGLIKITKNGSTSG